jgi:hypothetical protein
VLGRRSYVGTGSSSGSRTGGSGLSGSSSGGSSGSAGGASGTSALAVELVLGSRTCSCEFLISIQRSQAGSDITRAAGRLAESAWALARLLRLAFGCLSDERVLKSRLGRATQFLWRSVSWRPQASSPNHAASPKGRSPGGMGALSDSSKLLP